MPLQPPHLKMLERAVRGVPVCPSKITTALDGPHAAGAEVPIAAEHVALLPAHVQHCALDILQGLVHDLGFRVAMAGLLAPPNPVAAYMFVLFDLGDVRFMVTPCLTVIGQVMSFQLASCVWHWQGFMTGHSPSVDEDWLDLCTNYNAYFLRDGYAYRDVQEAYFGADQARQWGIYRSPLDRVLGKIFGAKSVLGQGEVVFGDPTIGGLPIRRSDRMNSFFHFQVGENEFPSGSGPGLILRRVQLYLSEKARLYTDVFGPPLYDEDSELRSHGLPSSAPERE